MLRNAVVLLLIVLSASLAAAAPAPAPEAGTAAPAKAAPPAPPAPAAPAAPAAPDFQATVVSVSGPAQKLLAGQPQAKWQPLKAGEKLGPLTLIRTGLGAKVVLKFEDRGVFTVNNGTKIGIAELEKKGQAAKARMGLKYGTLHAKVDSTRGTNDFQIATPVATLSVRGSEADVGSMLDSDMFLDTGSGNWQSSQQQSTPGGGSTTTTNTYTGGESGTSSGAPPITVTTNNQFSQSSVTDNFGTTGSEFNSFTQGAGSTGKSGINTPTGGSDTTTSGGDSVVPPQPDEPGWP